MVDFMGAEIIQNADIQEVYKGAISEMRLAPF